MDINELIDALILARDEEDCTTVVCDEGVFSPDISTIRQLITENKVAILMLR